MLAVDYACWRWFRYVFAIQFVFFPRDESGVLQYWKAVVAFFRQSTGIQRLINKAVWWPLLAHGWMAYCVTSLHSLAARLPTLVPAEETVAQRSRTWGHTPFIRIVGLYLPWILTEKSDLHTPSDTVRCTRIVADLVISRVRKRLRKYKKKGKKEERERWRMVGGRGEVEDRGRWRWGGEREVEDWRGRGEHAWDLTSLAWDWAELKTRSKNQVGEKCRRDLSWTHWATN